MPCAEVQPVKCKWAAESGICSTLSHNNEHTEGQSRKKIMLELTSHTSQES